MNTLFIGIAGGSGSGKTTIAHELYDQFKNDRIRIITEDSYYKNHPEMTMAERNKINFDHPDAFDTELLISQLQDLLSGKAIEMPIYDFTTHLRSPETVHVEPADIIILEGILVLASEELRNLMDIKIFVDTDDDIRLIRRQRRDGQRRQTHAQTERQRKHPYSASAHRPASFPCGLYNCNRL